MLDIQEQIGEASSEPLLETAEEARVARIRSALDEIRPIFSAMAATAISSALRAT